MENHAVFGGGCFWCTEAVFSRLQGVSDVKSGYAGGTIPNPSYDRVSSGTTGHAEVIQVTFDPAAISYETLLDVFFATHNPTTLNQQGNDVGTQYRSVIFYEGEEQRSTAETYITKLNSEKTFSQDVVTTVEPLTAFYPAEEYHQRYYDRNKDQSYCQFVIDPKIAKLRQKFAHLLRNE